MKKKLTFIILCSIFISFLILIIVSAINIRYMGIKGAEEKAEIAAELVKSGLTSHMVNGTMGNREYFLKKIENSPNIKSLWLTRSNSVEKQFGPGLGRETSRDKVDLEVMNSGKIYTKVKEASNKAELRVAIPYMASKHGNPNCMSCHNAKEGEVLGTVSMVVDISDVRINGFMISIIIFLISITIMLIIFLILNKTMNPLLKLFESITSVMDEAQNGNYSKRVKNTSNVEEHKKVTFGINSLLNKIQDTIVEIEHTVDNFITFRSKDKNDILIELKELVKEISNIHNFKKTIECDENKMQIYFRMGVILQERFKIDDFVLVEHDKKNISGTKVVFSTYSEETHKVEVSCRALRTKEKVSSDLFSNICVGCSKIYKHYYCVPFVISNDLEIMVHIGTENHSILELAKVNLEKFKDYINVARPEIVSKDLTEILKVSSITDPLTGLYNRKYLDEYIDKALAQADRSNITYGVLMIDIDYFKMVNDNYGHDIGDIVIKELSKVLKNTIRKSDIAFRFGGEEFLVLLYNCNVDMVERIAQKIRISFEEKVHNANNEITFTKTLSIGTALSPNDAKSIWKSIKFADISLYKAKNSGRNKVVNFDSKYLDNKGIGTKY